VFYFEVVESRNLQKMSLSKGLIMVRIARFAWDESLGPLSEVISPKGDVWDSSPVDRGSKNPNSEPKKPRKTSRKSHRSQPSEPPRDRAA